MEKLQEDISKDEKNIRQMKIDTQEASQSNTSVEFTRTA